MNQILFANSMSLLLFPQGLPLASAYPSFSSPDSLDIASLFMVIDSSTL